MLTGWLGDGDGELGVSRRRDEDIRVWGSWQRKEGENDGSTWLVVMGPSHELEDFRIAFYEYIKLRGILIIGG